MATGVIGEVGDGDGVDVAGSSKSSSKTVAPVTVLAVVEFAVVVALAVLDADGGLTPALGVGSARLL